MTKSAVLQKTEVFCSKVNAPPPNSRNAEENFQDFLNPSSKKKINNIAEDEDTAALSPNGNLYGGTTAWVTYPSEK